MGWGFSSTRGKGGVLKQTGAKSALRARSRTRRSECTKKKERCLKALNTLACPCGLALMFVACDGSEGLPPHYPYTQHHKPDQPMGVTVKTFATTGTQQPPPRRCSYVSSETSSTIHSNKCDDATNSIYLWA
eukprot:4407272-Amphidinium_carterae.1